MHPIFNIREKETPEIVALLNSVTLGTNGAHYRHLDTTERIKDLDKPVFISLERNDRTIGNVTFCRRGNHWYVRYFAFSPKFQSAGKKKSMGDSFIKKELNGFFQSVLDGENENGQAESFYAYIDPNNEKSLWLSENLGFETIGKVATQTFSRVNPKNSNRVKRSEDWNEMKDLVEIHFGDHQHFFLDQTCKAPFYTIQNQNGEFIAFAKTTISTWEIKRFPGKMGAVLIKIIPFIPRLNKLIRPKRQTFVVPEAVIVKDNDPKLLAELFEGILCHENMNLIIWWVDETETLYTDVHTRVKWGLLNKLVGVSKVNIVQRSNLQSNSDNPFYTSGFDFI